MNVPDFYVVLNVLKIFLNNIIERLSCDYYLEGTENWQELTHARGVAQTHDSMVE